MKRADLIMLSFTTDLVQVVHTMTQSDLQQVVTFCYINSQYRKTCLLEDSMGKNPSGSNISGANCMGYSAVERLQLKLVDLLHKPNFSNGVQRFPNCESSKLKHRPFVPTRPFDAWPFFSLACLCPTTRLISLWSGKLHCN